MRTGFLVIVEDWIFSDRLRKHVRNFRFEPSYRRLFIRVTTNLEINKVHMNAQVFIKFFLEIIQIYKVQGLFTGFLIVKSFKLVKFFSCGYQIILLVYGNQGRLN